MYECISLMKFIFMIINLFSINDIIKYLYLKNYFFFNVKFNKNKLKEFEQRLVTVLNKLLR